MASNDTESPKPLAEWHSLINRQVLTLHQLMLLRTRREDEQSRQKMAPVFTSLADSIAEIERSVRDLKLFVAEEKAQLAKLGKLHNAIEYQKERVALMKSQMPAEVTDLLDLNRKPDAEDLQQQTKEEQPVEQPERREPSPVKTKRKPVAASSKAGLVRKQTRGGKGGRSKTETKEMSSSNTVSNVDVPVISSVSQEELDAAPQYVKGRLTVEKIDGVVKSLNAIATSKYQLLGKPYRELNSNEINLWQDFRENECSETTGRQFLTDSEIKGFGNFRLDATAKSVINILRHVGALKEIRGKNKARIFIIN